MLLFIFELGITVFGMQYSISIYFQDFELVYNLFALFSLVVV